VAVLSVLLTALAYGVTALDPRQALLGMFQPGIGGFILVALVLAPVFWRLENRAADPVLQPRLFRSRQMIVAGLLAIGTGMSETSGVFLPALAVTGLGMSPHQASFWMIPTVIALTIGSPLAGRLLDRIGSKIIVQAGLLLTSIGFFLFAWLGTDIVWFVVGQLLCGLGLAALLGAPLRYVVLNEARPEERGAAQGLLVVVLSIGQLSGAALVGAIASGAAADRPEGFQQGFLVIGVIMALTVVIAFGLKNRAAERATASALAG
jgi:MFS family permease